MQMSLFVVLLGLSIEGLAVAQTVNLSLGSGSATRGGSISLNLTLAGGAQPAAIEWSLGYSTTDISSITVSAGASTNSAGKTIACSNGTGSVMCLVYGINSTTISDGIVAQVAVNLAPATTSSSTTIQLAGAVAASSAGTSLPTTASAGVIAILQPLPTLTSLGCSPSSVVATGPLSCTIALSGPAPAGGFSVSLSSNSAEVSVPSTLLIAAGSASGVFTATVKSVAAPGTAVLTALAGSVSKTASIVLAAPLVTSLSCPADVASGASGTCTVTLMSAAPASGASVSLSSSNPAITVPPTVIVPSGASSAAFTISAAGTMVEQVWLTACLNATSAKTMVTVLALAIQGSPSELSGWSNGATVTPSQAPPAFTGQLVINGNGAVKFSPVGSVNGVSFWNCCYNTNNSYYKFTGAALGNLFNLSHGKISFNLKSSYSFAQRQTVASGSRLVFAVQDNVAAEHFLFYFYTGYVANSLVFAYDLGGTANISYSVPQGTEDKLFGDGVVLHVALSWSNGVANLYLNGSLVQSTSYSQATANWTSASEFDFGAMQVMNYGAFESCDDKISQFTVGVPIGQ
jgi:hypothetical protein